MRARAHGLPSAGASGQWSSVGRRQVSTGRFEPFQTHWLRTLNQTTTLSLPLISGEPGLRG
jgi:hypothetical protein